MPNANRAPAFAGAVDRRLAGTPINASLRASGVVKRHRIVKRRRVASHLAERTDPSVPLDGGALTLSSDQVLKVIGLAYGTK